MQLINVDNLDDSVLHTLPAKCGPASGKVVVFMGDLDDPKVVPRVDAVPVVRCRDCKYWTDGTPSLSSEINWGSCSKLYDRYSEDCESNFDNTTTRDDFCSYGEQKETDNE